MPFDVFISYASEDISLAQSLFDQLDKEGFKIWFDKVRLSPGFDWYKEIEQGCENSRVVLPVLTPRWKNSDWTKYETYGAEAVIPLIFEGEWSEIVTPPLEWFQAEKIEFTSPSAANWLKLNAAIRRVLSEPRPDKNERIYNLRYRSCTFFTGREKELIRIHEELHCNPQAVLTQGRVRAIAAMGGAGKTTLVRQYAEKFWRCYQQMFWVDCRIGFETEFAHIHDILFPDRSNSGLKDSEKASLALQKLNGTETRLLIIDNAEDESSSMKWIPKTGGCHTLITSRFSGWSSVVKTIHLFVLEKEPSVEFLQKRIGHRCEEPEMAACRVLAEKLGYLPLALEQAGAYIEQQGDGYGFSDYLNLYNEATNDLLASGALGSTEYPDSVITTWKPSIEKLSPEARSLIRLCAFFAATPIPIKMLIEGSDILIDLTFPEKDSNKSPVITSREFWIRSQLKQLGSYSLVRLDGQSFSIHPLLQKVEQFAIHQDTYNQLISKAIDLLLSHAPKLADLPDTWTEWNILNPHAVELHSHSGVCDPKTRIALLDVLARFAFGKARYYESLAYEEEAFRICEESYGAEAEETEDRLLNYGESLRTTEQFDKAEAVFRQCLRQRKNRYGLEHIDVATANNYLGLLLRIRDRNDEAESCLQEGLAICKTIGTSSGRTYLKLLLNLAYIRISQNPKEAEQFARTAYDQAEKEYGPNDLLSIWSIEALAISLNNQKKYTEAMPFMLESVKRMLLMIGPEHPESLSSQECLSILYENTGDYENALHWAEETYNHTKSAKGENSIVTIKSVQHLGEVHLKKGNLIKAEQLFRQVLSGTEECRDASSFDDSSSLAGLIEVLEKSDRTEEIRPLRLKLVKKKLNNPDISPLQRRETALTCYNIKEYKLAEQLLDENLKVSFEIPGTHCHLARICFMTDRISEAQNHIELAWKHQEEAPSYVVARILWFKTALAFLTGESSDIFIAQLKSVLLKDDSVTEWSMQPVLDHIKPKLTDKQNSFLKALVDALSFRDKISSLEEFEIWRIQKPEPF